MTGKPVFAASEREKVLFPDPAIPVTRTRRPIPKAASLIGVSVPQVLYQAHQLAASNSLRRPVVGTNRGTKPWAVRTSPPLRCTDLESCPRIEKLGVAPGGLGGI